MADDESEDRDMTIDLRALMPRSKLQPRSNLEKLVPYIVAERRNFSGEGPIWWLDRPIGRSAG